MASSQIKKIVLYSFLSKNLLHFKNEYFRTYFNEYLTSIQVNATNQQIVTDFNNVQLLTDAHLKMLLDDDGLRDQMYTDFIESSLNILSNLLGGGLL